MTGPVPATLTLATPLGPSELGLAVAVPSARPAFPALLQANAVQFGPGERFGFSRVESRMVAWCRAGQGEVWVNGVRYALTPGVLLVLPWGHRICYAAADVDPFLMLGVHLVPQHDEGYPVEPSVPHDPLHPHAGCGWRRDGEPFLGGHVLAATADAAPGLAQLSAYAVEVWRRGTPSESLVRALGTMLAGELAELASRRDVAPAAGPDPFGAAPDELQRVLAYVENHLADRLTVTVLAEVGGCSGATLSRRFVAHFRRSPMEWVLEQRIERARGLLRATPLTVAQVAHRSGFVDANYFSRVFRERTGQPPTVWRRRQRLL